MGWWLHYSYFLICSVTVLLTILGLVIGMVAILKKPEDHPDQIKIKNLNKQYEALEKRLQETVLPKEAFKALLKSEKKAAKTKAKANKVSSQATDAQSGVKPRLFVVPYEDDIRARHVTALSRMIDAVLMIAQPKDTVLVSITSGGGVVHGYGLAAAELQRIRHAGIPLVASVDKVAASGGYMMAAVADQIIAAPFAIVGSIGVVAQMPNFHRLLKKHGIDFEQVTAGEYKRTLTTFGENTDSDREKVQEEVNETQVLFKEHVSHARPQVDLAKVATGAHWYGQQAIALGLVDVLQTSADYLLSKRHDYDIFLLTSKKKKSRMQKLFANMQTRLTDSMVSYS